MYLFWVGPWIDKVLRLTKGVFSFGIMEEVVRYKAVVVFLFSLLVPLSAMQVEQGGSEECSVIFQIQIPSPLRKTPEKQVNMVDHQAVVRYLQMLRNANEIPLSMYDFIIKEAGSVSISEELSEVLLRLWGINPDILTSGRSELIKAIGDTLLDVKKVISKK